MGPIGRGRKAGGGGGGGIPHKHDGVLIEPLGVKKRGFGCSKGVFLKQDFVGSITSRCSGKEPALRPELTAGLVDLSIVNFEQ